MGTANEPLTEGSLVQTVGHVSYALSLSGFITTTLRNATERWSDTYSSQSVSMSRLTAHTAVRPTSHVVPTATLGWNSQMVSSGALIGRVRLAVLNVGMIWFGSRANIAVRAQKGLLSPQRVTSVFAQ
jgi:hypothetical protein